MRSERGQASLMVGLMMLTFILFFAFVVNVGSLVNAKINLQNAADMAAYSGAAVQARQLNQISFLNYEMRRQFKKFLFRYYVLGNMSQDTNPQGPGQQGKRQWVPNLRVSPVTNYTVPTVCIIFTGNDNYCHLTNQPEIRIASSSSLDQITEALNNTLKQLELIRQEFCKGIGAANAQLLMYWLWNTDPDLTTIKSKLDQVAGQAQSGDAKKLVDTLKLIAQAGDGMGLVPRELLLRMRIQTLADYVNAPALNGLTLEKVADLEDGTDPVLRERTVQAFYSAYYTLGSHAFDDSKEIVMDELLPGGFGGDSANLLGLKDIKTTFDTFVVDFQKAQNSGACVASLLPASIDQPIPVGVAKDPELLTYYAVRLKAKANAIFLPRSWGDLELKAYAAAQPFGSRIGPNLKEDDFTRPAQNVPFVPLNSNGNTQSLVGRIPLLGLTEKANWEDLEMQGAAYSILAPGNQSRPVITPENLAQAYHAAMAPNPIEEGKYNILNDLNQDPFLQPFNPKTGTYAFWAPVLPPEKEEKAGQEIAQMMDAMFRVPPVRGMTQQQSDELKTQLTVSFTEYLGKLKQGQGENGEGFRVVRLENPYRLPATAPQGAANQPVKLQDDLLLKDVTQVKTSWVNKNDDENVTQLGRMGYSVKFVSFSSLRNPKDIPSDGNTPWRNLINADSEFESDWQSLKH